MNFTFKAEYDVCAFLILLCFALITSVRQKFPSLTGILYTSIVGCLMLSSVTEAAFVHGTYRMGVLPDWAKYFLLCTDMFLICLICFVFSIYVFLLLRKGKYTEKRWFWYPVYLAGVLALLSIVTTPFTHWIFYFKDERLEIGPLYPLIDIVLLGYMTYSVVLIIVMRKNLILRDRIALYVFMLTMGMGLVIQAATKEYLVTNFLMSLGIIQVYYSQQNNYNKVDVNSNLYNRTAMAVYMNQLINSNESFLVMALIPDKLAEVIHEKGTFYADAILRQIGDKLHEIYQTTSLYSLEGGRFAIVERDMDYEKMQQNVKRVFKEGFRVGGEYFEMTASGCMLSYPEGFDTADAAIALCERGVDLASKKGHGTIVTFDNYSEIRDSVVIQMKKEQIQLEQEKVSAERAKEQAEKADKAKSTFLAHMSHEIRTPLTAILGITELMLRDELPEKTRENIENIYSAGDSLLQIINDILDFSKIESGKFEIIEQEYNIVDTLESVINILQVRCEDKPIEVITDIDMEIPSLMIGDEKRIRQVLYNFASNAAKYTDRGTITFTVSWDAQKSELVAQIRDTGRGIRDEDKEKLFESFIRIDEQKNRNIEGTGLGLAITKQIIEMMGGELMVESVFGEGSCFAMKLKQQVVDETPIKNSTEDGSLHSSHKMSTLRYFVADSARVLVVDDNRYNRTIAEELIKPHRVTVDTANSGRECLKMAEENNYDIIFLDHMMPELDGIETLKLLQESQSFIERPIPVIVFSANAVSGMKEEFKTAGFVDFLSKPISVEELERMLVEYLPQELVTPVTQEEFEKLNRKDKGRIDKTSMDFLKDNFSVPGVDFMVGLKYTENSADSYFKLLKVVVQDKPSILNNLEQSLGNKDISAYTICIHGVKSNLASIGAEKLSEKAKALEMAGKTAEWDYIVNNHEAFKKEYCAICDGLSKAVNDYNKWNELAKECLSSRNETEVLTSLSDIIPKLGDRLACIELLLNDFEYDTAIQMAELFERITINADEKEKLESVIDKLHRFDYEGAADRIKAIRQ